MNLSPSTLIWLVAVVGQAFGADWPISMGDQRSTGSGWGHIAAPTPSVAGPHLYIPVMNGTVYVIDWNSPKLDESAIVGINDLGPAGQSYTRASLSFSAGHAFAHTILQLICIGR